MRIILIGMPRVGKTNVGRELAKRLQVKFLDSDFLLAKKYGTSVSELFDKYGKAQFRALEFLTLKEIFQNNKSFVLATGGGVVDYEPSVKLLRAEKAIVYLTAPLEVIARRILQQKKGGKKFPSFFNCKACEHFTFETEEICKICIIKKLNAIFLSREQNYKNLAYYSIENTAEPEFTVSEILKALAPINLLLEIP